MNFDCAILDSNHFRLFTHMDDSSRYKLLKLLHENPELSQRDLAKHMGISLGKTNYCLQSLIKIGVVKVSNFRNSKNKMAYLYKLTPNGLEEKSRVTKRFLAHKLKEYDAIKKEIYLLKKDMDKNK